MMYNRAGFIFALKKYIDGGLVMNLVALNEIAGRFEFQELLEALENLSYGERNLEDRFLRDTNGEVLSGLVCTITQRSEDRWNCDPLVKRKEDAFLRKILTHASKKTDTVISSIAGGWKSLDPKEFINYLVGFIDFDNSLKKAAAFCEVVIKSLSKETAESWLKTLEFLDGCCLDEKQYLVCYLLRARLQIDWHLHTAYRQLPYCGDWT